MSSSNVDVRVTVKAPTLVEFTVPSLLSFLEAYRLYELADGTVAMSKCLPRFVRVPSLEKEEEDNKDRKLRSRAGEKETYNLQERALLKDLVEPEDWLEYLSKFSMRGEGRLSFVQYEAQFSALVGYTEQTGKRKKAMFVKGLKPAALREHLEQKLDQRPKLVVEELVALARDLVDKRVFVAHAAPAKPRTGATKVRENITDPSESSSKAVADKRTGKCPWCNAADRRNCATPKCTNKPFCFKCKSAGHLAKSCPQKDNAVVNFVGDAVNDTKEHWEVWFGDDMVANALVDTGSPRCFVRSELVEAVPKLKVVHPTELFGPTGESIGTPTEFVILSCGGRLWDFQLLDGLWETALIGRDFLQGQEFEAAVVEKFPAVLAGLGDRVIQCPLQIPAIQLTDQATPVVRKARHLNNAQANFVKSEVEQLMKLGVVEFSDSSWVSPIVVVPKPPSFRMCIDFRELNAVTIEDPYQSTTLMDVTRATSGAKWFAVVDLERGYNQLLVPEESRSMLGFCFPGGQMQYSRLPFGLRNASKVFQRVLDRLLRGCKGVVIYIDDILIFAFSLEELELRVNEVLRVLGENLLMAKASKCKFGLRYVEYLGIVLGPGLRCLTVNRLRVLEGFEFPKTVKEVRSVLGAFNFVREFLPEVEKLMRPMYQLTHGKTSSQKIVATPEALEAFEALKVSVNENCCLSVPDYGLEVVEFVLHTDACNTGIGAYLEQKGVVGILSFWSYSFKGAQLRWNTTEQEAYGVVWGVRKADAYAAGFPLTVYTDHRNLTFLSSSTNAKVMRWNLALMERNVEIKFISGCDNVIADGLSRGNMEAVEEAPPLEEVVAEVVNAIVPEFVLERDEVPAELLAEDDITLEEDRIKVVHEHWAVNHPAVDETLRQCTLAGFTPSKELVKKVVGNCEACKHVKLREETRAPMTEYESSKPFETIHIDLAGPFEEPHEIPYVLLVIDRNTRYVQLIALSGMTSAEILDALFVRWVSVFGVPRKIISDNAAYFVGQGFKSTVRDWGVEEAVTVAPYHPSANGLVERVVRKLKEKLKLFMVAGAAEVLSLRGLAAIQVQVDSSVNRAIGCSPFERVFHKPSNFCNTLVQSEDWSEDRSRTFDELSAQALERYTSAMKRQVDKSSQDARIGVGDNVLILEANETWTGPFQVVEVTGVNNENLLVKRFRRNRVEARNVVRNVHTVKLF